MKTETIKIDDSTGGGLGRFRGRGGEASNGNGSGGTRNPLDTWEVAEAHPAVIGPLRRAAEYLHRSDTPVAFPTETVYGLGADATRSAAVRGIYAAKGRPSDNPLIVHVCDLDMLRGLLGSSDEVPARGGSGSGSGNISNGVTNGEDHRVGGNHSDADPIPPIYRSLVERFWPGPLTILLPNPAAGPSFSPSSSSPSSSPSSPLTATHHQKHLLAPEVTAGLPTFGARMPASPLALTLIKLTGVPLAAPSANASTRPSPTAARHVLDDLDGRLELILDGGDCEVGVESTVVDGLCDPPVVLRPGGVSIEELRRCPGWEGVQKAYKDAAQEHFGGVDGNGRTVGPRAPGMKYKHYSPRAKVVLYEKGFSDSGGGGGEQQWAADLAEGKIFCQRSDGAVVRPTTLGIIRTRPRSEPASSETTGGVMASSVTANGNADAKKRYWVSTYDIEVSADGPDEGPMTATKVLDINLGQDISRVARGLFSSLRELDARGADLICVEGVGDGDGIAAAVMNRLRKAASEIR